MFFCNPSNLEHIIADDDDKCFESVSNNQPGNTQQLFDEYGKKELSNCSILWISDKIIETSVILVSDILIYGDEHVVELKNKIMKLWANH